MLEQSGSVPSLAAPRSRIRFLDTLRSPPVFHLTRVRSTYQLGLGGLLGAVPGQEVRELGGCPGGQYGRGYKAGS